MELISRSSLRRSAWTGRHPPATAEHLPPRFPRVLPSRPPYAAHPRRRMGLTARLDSRYDHRR
ncbi:hypothetical protein KCH_69850 [Kitasatospora cheerisanensis KCTC 2395]|uniref:Uncharacterized protein n=1 Tax=Kitasatospora cheerisanensis KCTC 2395 TaxID=1348663 RepID=A0A066YIP1_9ACTN|nr:hypothetical protein KCH_69850 [Kitasatospora cheerisanensis KCTC 2395]